MSGRRGVISAPRPRLDPPSHRRRDPPPQREADPTSFQSRVPAVALILFVVMCSCTPGIRPKLLRSLGANNMMKTQSFMPHRSLIERPGFVCCLSFAVADHRESYAALRADEIDAHSEMPADDSSPAALNERYPCNSCALASSCAAQLLACAAFQRYINRHPWKSADRVPTSERWRMIFASGKARGPQAAGAPGEALSAAARKLGVCYETLKKWIRLGAPVLRRRGATLRGTRVDVAAVAKWQITHLPHYDNRHSPIPYAEQQHRERRRLSPRRWRVRGRAAAVNG